MKKNYIILIFTICSFKTYSQLNCTIKNDKEPYNLCLGDTVKIWNECSNFLDSTIWFIGVDLKNLKKIAKDTADYIITDTSIIVNPITKTTIKSYINSLIYYKDKNIGANGIRFNELYTSFYVCPINNPQFKSSTRTICERESVDFFDLSNHVPTRYQWTFEGGEPKVSVEKNPKGIVYSQAGKYKVTLEVSNSQGAKKIEKVDYIEVLAKKNGIQDTVSVYNTLLGATLNLESCNKGDKYQWLPDENLDCNNCEKVGVKAKKSTTYICRVKTNQFCDVVCTYIIHVDSTENIFIPNIFSPNDDGINDYLEVFYKNAQYIEFSIFDRRGDFIFNSKNPTLKWDGNFRGQALPNDTYTYYFEYLNLINGNKEIKKGTVSILR